MIGQILNIHLTFYIIEFTVGFQSNLNINAEKKYEKYHQLTRELSSDFHNVKFINSSLKPGAHGADFAENETSSGHMTIT